jgi:CRISPR-associated endonuclease/helicase Cas3
MPGSDKKANHLLQIEALLLAHPEGLTQAEIARRLGLHRSTVGRYLPDLSKHIYVDDTDGNRWKIDREAYLVQVRLNLHEALAVHLAARLLATRMDRQNPHAAAALRKLGVSLERLAPTISRHLQQSADVMDDAAQRHDPSYLQVLEKLTLGWAERRKLRIWHRYEQTGEVHDYVFAPYFIEPYAVGQTAHVIGRREPPGALRTFKIERIERAELLRETYELPADFDPRQILASAWGIWYTESEPRPVVLRFHPRVAHRVLETRWHRSEQVSQQSDGSVLWQAQVAEPQEMLPWIRGWGADVEVVGPKELRRALVAEVRHMTRLYGLAATQPDSPSARVLRCWGKTGTGAAAFHPAVFHMLDVGHVARALLENPGSSRWRDVLARALGADPGSLADWLPWIVALHDIGKVSATFQHLNEEQKARLQDEGFTFGRWRTSLDQHHTVVGQVFLKHELQSGPVAEWPESLQTAVCEMIGGHHGQFPPPDRRKKARYDLQESEPAEWRELRVVAVDLLAHHLLRTQTAAWPESANVSTATAALTGFTILCDWLGSASEYFDLQPDEDLEEYAVDSAQRALQAVTKAGLTQPSRSSAPVAFAALFPDKQPTRPLQEAIDAIPPDVLRGPCLAIMEAPTGEGKTEAALALAHRLAAASGTDEFYYALPTTATSNQMFGRVQAHVRDRLGLAAHVKLVHGQAFLVEDDLRIEPLDNGDHSSTSVTREWFSGKKRALLAPFGVGTIDQAELAALNVRHAVLRLAGLAGKVLIIDEVHAYDTYMTTIIERLLVWLYALGTSVVLLSATLPQARRATLARAYGADLPATGPAVSAYPSLWIAGSSGIYHAEPAASQPDRRIAMGRLAFSEDDDEGKARWLVDAVAEGGCACWMANTVERAQRVFKLVDQLAPREVDRLLLHAAFPLDQRQVLEEHLSRQYGPGDSERPTRGIIVGTQVLEQSLDLDFDVLVSDLAPIDLLLQRAGRLHRHARDKRPARHAIPRLWINATLGPDRELQLGVDRYIYAEYFLRQTWIVLADRTELQLPGDYRLLIETVYSELESRPGDILARAWDDLQDAESKAEQEARLRLMPAPDPEDSFAPGMARLAFEENENSAAWIVAQTRLGEESVNVIPLEHQGNQARLLPSGESFDLDQPLPRAMQLNLLRHGLRVSRHAVVQALKEQPEPLAAFARSALLKEHRPLWFSDGEARLVTRKKTLVLRLDARLGLVVTQEGG